MIGSKYLSELVDCSTFQKGKLNLIKAPTGCGKTAFCFEAHSSPYQERAFQGHISN